MTLKERYSSIIEWFSENRPNVESELHFNNEFQLLVAVMLSAQCTDKRVNMVTPALFAAFPDAQALASASVEDVYALIKSISYPNAKARHLVEMSSKLLSDFNGRVPSTVEELVTLPGVGRKTANVVSGICFGAAVIPVDTHVFRVSKRLGLAKGDNVREVEEELMKNTEEQVRMDFHHWLLLHGRYVCTARNPYCEDCNLKKWCKGYEQNNIKKNK